jgi:hypothetical protein
LKRVTCFRPSGCDACSHRPAPTISAAVMAATEPTPIAESLTHPSASPSCQMSGVTSAKTPVARAAVSALDSPIASFHGWLARIIPISSRTFPLRTLAVNMTLPSPSCCWLRPSSRARRPRPATEPSSAWSSVSPSKARTRPTTVSRLRRRSPMAPSAGRHTTATPCRGLA